MEILKYFKTPFLKYFMKFSIFIIKWLKTFKNMIKVYEVSRTYIMLFMDNNRYLPLTGLLTLLQWTIQPAPIVHHEIFEIFQEYFTRYFLNYFTPKNFMKFYITSHETRNPTATTHSLTYLLIYTNVKNIQQKQWTEMWY